MQLAAMLGALVGPLGLAPFEPLVGYEADAPFGRLKRALGPRIESPAIGCWLRGEHAGATVLVVPHHHDGGTGWELRTACIAAIDPPLFLNMELHEQLLLDPRDPLGRNDVRIGEAVFDGAVHASAPDHQRLTWFLAPWRPDSRHLLAAIADGVSHGLRVTDTTVTVAFPGIPTPIRAQQAFALTTWLARALAERRRTFAPSNEERARAHRWHQVARRRGLAFDAQRMMLSGEIEGSAVEIALEPTPTADSTATTLTIPGAPPGLRLRKLHYRAPWSVTEPDAIPLESEAFDRALVARGERAAVRAALANVVLRRELVALAGEATELMLDGERLTWVSGPAAYEAEIEAKLARGLAIAGALPRAAQSPYR